MILTDDEIRKAAELGVPQDKAHIGMFDIAQCKRVVQIAAKEQI